jgi:hypothetical protein
LLKQKKWNQDGLKLMKCLLVKCERLILTDFQ